MKFFYVIIIPARHTFHSQKEHRTVQCQETYEKNNEAGIGKTFIVLSSEDLGKPIVYASKESKSNTTKNYEMNANEHR